MKSQHIFVALLVALCVATVIVSHHKRTAQEKELMAYRIIQFDTACEHGFSQHQDMLSMARCQEITVYLLNLNKELN